MSGRTAAGSPARTPEALHAILEDAVNSGNLDAYANAYDEGAVLVVPPDGRTVRGREDIRAAAAPLFARQPHITIVVRKKFEADGLALTHTQWELVDTDADGNRSELSGQATVVSRRRPDGTWGIVLDNTLSPA